MIFTVKEFIEGLIKIAKLGIRINKKENKINKFLTKRFLERK